MDEKETISEKPEVYCAKQVNSNWQFTRREFIAASGALGVVLASSNCRGTSETTQMCNQPGFIAHELAVDCMAISPDNHYLISADENEHIKIWSLPDGQLIYKFDSGQVKINSMLIDSTSSTLITAGGNFGIKVWSIPDGNLIREFHHKHDFIREIFFCNDDKQLISFHSYEVIFWNIASGKSFSSFDMAGKKIDRHAISADGKTLVVLSKEGEVIAWDIPSQRMISSFEVLGIDIEMRKIEISADGKALAVLSHEGELEIWSIATGKKITQYSDCNGIAFSPVDEILAIIEDNSIHMCSGPDYTSMNQIGEHDGNVASMLFTHDGKLLLTSSQKGSSFSIKECISTIKFWSMPDGKCKKKIGVKNELERIKCISPDDRWLLTIYSDGKDTFLRCRALPGGRIKKKWMVDEDGLCQFSDDGSYLAVTIDKKMSLYSVPGGDLLTCFIDLESIASDIDVISVESSDKDGNVITQYLPCGSPIPPGAVCTCNCVSGGGCSCVGHTVSHSRHYWHPN